MVRVELPEEGFELLTEIRDARRFIADHRFSRSREIYPEIGDAIVSPLSDADIILIALRKERQHQVNVAKDISAEKRQG